ncbi:MAG: thermonuclease family protein [Candidatus Omnitrophica bacterium]|nr:thermonuclease family protein [Candidatus Omnitrophota bacterium]
MKRSTIKLLTLGVSVIALLISSYFNRAQSEGVVYNSNDAKFQVKFGKNYKYDNILVKRAVDGDTLLLENGERVRLIGIDTPEMHESKKLYRDSERSKQDTKTIQEMGKRAAEFTRNLVEGRPVRLEFDVDRYDKYKRLLAYVYLVSDGTFVNAKIIEEGYASVMTYPPNVKHTDEFVKLYRQARENNRGLWK